MPKATKVKATKEKPVEIVPEETEEFNEEEALLEDAETDELEEGEVTEGEEDEEPEEDDLMSSLQQERLGEILYEFPTSDGSTVTYSVTEMLQMSAKEMFEYVIDISSAVPDNVLEDSVLVNYLGKIIEKYGTILKGTARTWALDTFEPGKSHRGKNGSIRISQTFGIECYPEVVDALREAGLSHLLTIEVSKKPRTSVESIPPELIKEMKQYFKVEIVPDTKKLKTAYDEGILPESVTDQIELVEKTPRVTFTPSKDLKSRLGVDLEALVQEEGEF